MADEDYGLCMFPDLRDNSVKRFECRVESLEGNRADDLYISFQIEPKISARRLSDLHMTYGQVLNITWRCFL